jgi:peptide/nickel transport system substrate-binding protein
MIRSVFTGVVAALALMAISPDVLAQTAAKPLIIATNIEPDTLDITSSRNAPNARQAMTNVTEALVGFDTDGTPTPTIAEWVSGPDNKYIDFKLRQNVKFHSGDELTAEDIVFSDARMTAKTSIYSIRRNPTISSVEAVDKYTARFHMKSPDVTMLALRLLVVVSKKYYDRVGEDEFVKKPMGTGPYKVADYKPGQFLELVRNEDFWGPKPQVEKARFVFAKEDTTRTAMLKTGEADMIVNASFNDAAELKAAGFKTAIVPVPTTMGIRFNSNTKVAPTRDLKVRQAMAHAIDANAIVKGLFQGVPATYPRLAPGDRGFDPNLKAYEFNPALSKKLLAEAGYPNGFSIPMVYFTGGDVGTRETAEAITLYLKAVGITVVPQGSDIGVRTETYVKNKNNPDAPMFYLSPTVLAKNSESIDSLAASHSSSAAATYILPEFDKEVDLALASSDMKTHEEHVRKAVAAMHAEVMTIPIWTMVSVFATKKNIDFVPTEKVRFILAMLKDIKVN